MRVHSRNRQRYVVFASTLLALSACGGDKAKDQDRGRGRTCCIVRAWRSPVPGPRSRTRSTPSGSAPTPRRPGSGSTTSR